MISVEFTEAELSALLSKVGVEFHEDPDLRAAVQKLSTHKAAADDPYSYENYDKVINDMYPEDA